MDGGEVAAIEEEDADEFAEAQEVEFGFGGLGRQPQQDIGDHRRVDLQFDGVWAGPEELSKLEVLLEPSEQQLEIVQRIMPSPAAKSASVVRACRKGGGRPRM